MTDKYISMSFAFSARAAGQDYACIFYHNIQCTSQGLIVQKSFSF